MRISDWSSYVCSSDLQYVQHLVALAAEEVPAHLQMADKAVSLVLRGDGDAPDAGIDGVGEGEIDDARLAAEIDRRLGPTVGQLDRKSVEWGKRVSVCVDLGGRSTIKKKQQVTV